VRTFLARHVGINRTGLGCAVGIGCAANAGLGCVLENFLCAVGSLDGKRFGRGVDFGDCPAYRVDYMLGAKAGCEETQGCR